MKDLYAMQRANGDWFALDDHGRFRVPLFHSKQSAMMARWRHFGMLLFKPVALDARSLKEIAPVGTADDVDFWLVKDPFISLKRGHLVDHAQLERLMQGPVELKMGALNPNTLHKPLGATLAQSDHEANEHWEDEGGSYAKCA
jgi:hypothetical protein